MSGNKNVREMTEAEKKLVESLEILNDSVNQVVKEIKATEELTQSITLAKRQLDDLIKSFSTSNSLDTVIAQFFMLTMSITTLYQQVKDSESGKNLMVTFLRIKESYVNPPEATPRSSSVGSTVKKDNTFDDLADLGRKEEEKTEGRGVDSMKRLEELEKEAELEERELKEAKLLNKKNLD